MSPEDAWYRGLGTELASRGVIPQEVDRAVTDARAEAACAGLAPADLFGPAVLYARDLASALMEESSGSRRRDPERTPGPVVLRLRGVSVRRGRRTVLADLDLTVRRGEVVAVVDRRAHV